MTNTFVQISNEPLTNGGTNSVSVSGTPTAGQAIVALTATTASWQTVASGSVTLNGDVTGSSGSNVVASITGSGGQVAITSNVLLKGTILNDATGTAVTTTDATLTTLYTSAAIAASTVEDFIVSVVGLDSTNSDVYRADFSFTYQRAGSAAPSAVGATPIPLNVRGTTTGLTWGGASIAISGNTVLVKVQGIASTTIDWKCSFQALMVA